MESSLFDEPTLADADNDEELFGYLKLAREKLKEFYVLRDADGWELYKDEDGVAMWTKAVEGFDVKAIKRVMEVTQFYLIYFCRIHLFVFLKLILIILFAIKNLYGLISY